MAAPVVIDGRAAARARTGGVERWASELCRCLPALSRERYRVALPPKGFEHRLGHLWEQAVLPISARLGGAGLILCPANLAPVASRRTVAIVHDAAPLRHPLDYSPAYARWQAMALPRIVANARLVITPSEFSRAELVDVCGADPDSVRVVSPGVAEIFRRSPGIHSGRVEQPTAEPYVLVVASHVGRKNIGVLEAASTEMRRLGVRMVMAGGSMRGLRGHESGSGIDELGPIGDSTLGRLYAGAMALVLPSTYEGFGLPVIEAMASGTPVVCSDAGGLPEAADGAAILVDPSDADGFASALGRLVSDESLRAEMIGRGRTRTNSLTWDSTAREVDRILRGLLEPAS